MVLENSFEAPKDFKQVRNVKYQQSRKDTKNKIGHKNNLADEVLHCISMVDSHEFVQHCSKTKDLMPNFICYTENQRQDLIFFLSQKSNYPIGGDRTFNLGRFFVTALVYKNLRVVRANNADEHPLLLGPVFIHRDAIFEAYNYFLSTIKGSLYPQNSISWFDIRLGDGIYIGSDEERAIVNAIDINFPGSNVIMLETFERWCIELQVGVPQKIS